MNPWWFSTHALNVAGSARTVHTFSGAAEVCIEMLTLAMGPPYPRLYWQSANRW
jgi:hypothetical protein